MPPFKHIPLVSSSAEIRFLKLYLNGDAHDIRCIIITYPLDSKPAYTVLSYEWGDPERTVEILLNGKVFTARHNLGLFLNRMKLAAQQKCSKCSRGTTALLWIDALCVDQTNTTERNAQVQLMGTIYRDAREVVVWLGWAEDLKAKAAHALSEWHYGNATLDSRAVPTLPQAVCAASFIRPSQIWKLR